VYKRQVVEALGRIGSDKAIDALISALNDENSDMRWSVVEALGRIGSDKAVDGLISVLNDEDSTVIIQRAAEALGQIGSDKAVDGLITALNDEDSFVRWRAAEALGEIGSPSCLVKLIDSPQIDIYRSNIFSLARSIAIRFSKAGLPFIPVYPERVAGIKREEGRMKSEE
jgi:HEAT repeat protein